MKKIISIVSIVALAIGLLVSCDKNNVTPSSKSPLKDGVWTNYPDRTDLEKDVLPLIMKVSGTDIKFSAFSVEKGDIKYVSCEPALSYDESSNKGTVTIPSIGEYGGTSTFSMEGEEMMICVTQKLDTVHLVWCGESAEDWWKERPKRDFVIPEGEGLSKDLGVGREMMNLARTIFNESPEGGAQTKAEINDVEKDIFSTLSSTYNTFTWCMAIGGKNVTPAILAQLYKINRKLDVINQKLDAVLACLGVISTQIDLASIAPIINTRNEYLYTICNSFGGYCTDVDPLFDVQEDQRDSTYYQNVFSQLWRWTKNDKMITENLFNTISFLQSATYQNAGSMKHGMPVAYNDMLLATVGFEHEYGIGGEILRLSDISVVLTCAAWASLYLEACEHLGRKTVSGRDPDELFDVMKRNLSGMADFYNRKDNKLDLDEIRTRRICFIKDAHFMVTDTVLYHVDYSKIEKFHSTSAIFISFPAYDGKYYSSKPTWDFFRFLGKGDPHVLGSQNLVEVEMLEKVRDFYCAPGTPEYDNFFAADSISKLMLLDYVGTPEGQTAPLLVGFRQSFLMLDKPDWFLDASFAEKNIKVEPCNTNSWYLKDSSAPTVYFKGGEY